MLQLQSGYYLDAINKYVNRSNDSSHYKNILRSLSYFDLSSNIDLNANDADPLISVMSNIISRGLPTKPSIYIEEVFSEVFGKTKKTKTKTGGICYDFISDEETFKELLFRSYHNIDPRIKPDHLNKTDLGSNFEKLFLLNLLPEQYGNYLPQLVETQRNLDTILRFGESVSEEFKKYIEGAIDSFDQQTVDFSIEVPNENKGIVIEIDGSQHKEDSQKHLDNLRDDAVSKAGWEPTIRIPTSTFPNINSKLETLTAFLDQNYFRLLEQNYVEPLYEDEAGLIALQMALSPLAIARIQRVILELISSGNLSLEDEKWSIGILERDVPCGWLAVEDLKGWFEQLFILEGKKRKLPEIELQLYNTKAFTKAELNNFHSQSVALLEELNGQDVYFDLLIDSSILQRSSLDFDSYSSKAKIVTSIRSSHSPKAHREFKTTTLIKYPSLFEDSNYRSGITSEVIEEKERISINDEKHSALINILQSIFRKQTFRPGQCTILDRSLQLESLVGLMPTGGGKSLTYQISVLLQPGVSLVVDPIKSLMKDQYGGLVKADIDCAVYINSSLSFEEREVAKQKFMNGEVLFTFVSPERLQIKSFRNYLQEMVSENNTYFSYCVVDEAHCVSEWGHDFRTSYLRLGENARRYCLRKGASRDSETGLPEPSVPLIGLTATASFDVLTDVQRELNIDDSGIIRSRGLERKELNYRVLHSNKDSEEFSGSNEYELGKSVGETKQEHIINLLHEIPKELNSLNQSNGSDPESDGYNYFGKDNGKYKNAGLIFCPHKSWVFGVNDVASKIQKETSEFQLGTFMGSSDSDYTGRSDTEKISESNQEAFIEDELNLLVATKAFGMGIDKPNIRFTVHFNLPGSIESFYQEAGRAGRDREQALCYILFSGNEYDKSIIESFHQNSFKGEGKEKRIIYELLDEITYPTDKVSNDLTNAVYEKHGVNVEVNLWPKDKPRRLYANEDFNKGYGFLRLKDLAANPDGSTFDYDTSENVMEYIKEWIQERVSTDEDVVEKLKNVLQPEPAPGLEKRLQNVEVGEEIGPVTVGFRNDKVKKIAKILSEHIDDGYSELIVKRSVNYCQDPEEFIENLERNFYKSHNRNANLPEKVEEYVKKLFPRIRDEQDTFKAIYRLSSIGVIDDYEVDYNSKTISVYAKKKTDEDYIGHLYEYLSRYLSEERAKKVFMQVHDYKGESIIQKCLGVLIEFVYQEIAAKRQSAIDAMEEACFKGLENDKDFREFLEIYFDSRYYELLVEDTNQGKTFSFDIVQQYIEKVEGNLDSLKHLRGATSRLLTENPDNAALILLKAYVTILIDHHNEHFLDEAKKDIKDGFEKFQEYKKWIPDQMMENMSWFEKAILRENNSLKDYINEPFDLIEVRYINKQLSTINNKFLKGYEGRTTSGIS